MIKFRQQAAQAKEEMEFFAETAPQYANLKQLYDNKLAKLQEAVKLAHDKFNPKVEKAEEKYDNCQVDEECTFEQIEGSEGKYLNSQPLELPIRMFYYLGSDESNLPGSVIANPTEEGTDRLDIEAVLKFTSLEDATEWCSNDPWIPCQFIEENTLGGALGDIMWFVPSFIDAATWNEVSEPLLATPPIQAGDTTGFRVHQCV